MHEVERDGGLVVVHLLRESVRQPGEAPHAHPHRQILALYERRGDIRGVWVAGDALLKLARADGGAVATLGGRVLASVALVGLDEHRVVDRVAEGPLYGFQIGLVTIRSQLDPRRKSVG